MNQGIDAQKYLGDGVYASFDGYHIWLRIDGGHGGVTIALDPDVYQALVGYHAEIQKKLAERKTRIEGEFVGENVRSENNDLD